MPPRLMEEIELCDRGQRVGAEMAGLSNSPSGEPGAAQAAGQERRQGC
jgi:hypothetical protein